MSERNFDALSDVSLARLSLFESVEALADRGFGVEGMEGQIPDNLLMGAISRVLQETDLDDFSDLAQSPVGTLFERSVAPVQCDWKLGVGDVNFASQAPRRGLLRTAVRQDYVDRVRVSTKGIYINFFFVIDGVEYWYQTTPSGNFLLHEGEPVAVAFVPLDARPIRIGLSARAFSEVARRNFLQEKTYVIEDIGVDGKVGHWSFDGHDA